jgi:hypothetical protein
MTKVLKQCPGRDGRRIDFKDKEIFYYQYSDGVFLGAFPGDGDRCRK